MSTDEDGSHFCNLTDGTAVLLRPVARSDDARLGGLAHELFGPSAQRAAAVRRGSLAWLQPRLLIDLSPADGAAWIALDPARPDQPAVGVGRYLRLDLEPEVADAAVVVAPSHRRRGLGTLLLAALGRAAVRDGVEAFYAFVPADDRRLRQMLRQLGAAVRCASGSLLEVVVPVAQRLADLPNNATGRALAQAAAQLSPAGPGRLTMVAAPVLDGSSAA